MLTADCKERKSGRDNSREPFPFQTREAQAFPPTPSENRMARAPSPAWRLSSPPQPEYSHRLRRSETQLNYRCDTEESDELSNCPSPSPLHVPNYARAEWILN